MSSPSAEPPLLAAIEAGGTKYVCAVGYTPDKPIAEVRFPTRDPEDTLAEAISFFRAQSSELGPIHAIGIGTFGPAVIDPASPDYGRILTTPKVAWKGFNVISAIRSALGTELPLNFDTDVNAAVLSEARYGSAKGKKNVAYITIGTGIGAACLHDGKLLHGRLHPEVGHIIVPDYDSAYGKDTNRCDFHDSCFEGRAAGPAIEARWGIPGHELPDDHQAWDLQASYLATGCVTLTAAWSPDIIIIGGGVSQKPHLLAKVRKEFEKQAGGYWSLPPLEDYLTTPKLDQDAGIVGSLILAQQALASSQT